MANDLKKARHSGAFVRAKPGDILFHPIDGKPLAVVKKIAVTVHDNGDKPKTYSINIEAEDLP